MNGNVARILIVGALYIGGGLSIGGGWSLLLRGRWLGVLPILVGNALIVTGAAINRAVQA